MPKIQEALVRADNYWVPIRERTILTALAVVVVGAIAVTYQAPEPRHLPVDLLRTGMASEQVDADYDFDERVQADYTSDFHLSQQPYPSGGPDGARSYGTMHILRNGLAGSRSTFERQPSIESIPLPPIDGLGPNEALLISTSYYERPCSEFTVSAIPDMRRPEFTVLESNADPGPSDPWCLAAWPGFLGHRILPADHQPATLDDWYISLEELPFLYSHSIRIHGDTVKVYAYETNTDGIEEIREIGITKTGRLYYMNWWRSEPYPGENVNRRTVLRSIPDDKR